MRVIQLTRYRNVLSLLLAVSASASFAADSSSKQPAFGIVPAQVKSADGSRWTRFVDDKNREFAITYDSQGKLTSLAGVTRHTGNDLRTVTYLPDGRLSDVLFGNNYTLHFEYPDANTQLAVDALGNSVRREVNSTGKLVATAASDPNGVLSSTLNRLDLLFARVGAASSTSSTPAVVPRRPQ